MKRKKKKIVILICTIMATALILYFLLVNFLVSAALVPSFMQKLEVFDKITENSYAQQVQTADIITNRKTELNATEEWLRDMQSQGKCQKISVRTQDGYTLIAEEFLPDGESHNWVLLLHGYTGWKEEMYPFAFWYHEQGCHVVVPDLRCQGESEGDYIGMGWTDHYDCMLWVDYILAQDPNARIVLHGQSMGAATALMMTGEEGLAENVCAVISDCAYTDAYSMFGEKAEEWFYLPAFPLVDTACLLLKLRGGYDLKDASAINAVKESTTPTLFIHGDEDAMISVQMTLDLYETAVCEKELLIVEGAGHAQAQEKDPETYYDTVRSFLKKNLTDF